MGIYFCSIGRNFLDIYVKDSNSSIKCIFFNKLNMNLCTYLGQFKSRRLFGDNPIFWWIQGPDFLDDIGDKIKKIWRWGDKMSVALMGNTRGGSLRLKEVGYIILLL